jgi:hypothetical protein
MAKLSKEDIKKKLKKKLNKADNQQIVLKNEDRQEQISIEK